MFIRELDVCRTNVYHGDTFGIRAWRTLMSAPSASSRGKFILLFFVTATLVIISLAIQRDIQQRSAKSNAPPAGLDLPADQPVLPRFSLIERSGQPFTRQEMLGQTTIVSFIFTRCHETCPMVTGIMARLRQGFPATVKMVSITVDPRYDRPEQLRIYARNFGADNVNWWFLTGEREATYSLIREGFGLPVEENPNPARLPGELISHTTRLAIVDRQGRVRGYYDCRHPDVVLAVARRVEALEQEP